MAKKFSRKATILVLRKASSCKCQNKNWVCGIVLNIAKRATVLAVITILSRNAKMAKPFQANGPLVPVRYVVFDKFILHQKKHGTIFNE